MIKTEFLKNKTYWILLGILILVFFVSLSYIDLYTTYDRGLLLLDSILSGNFPHGYFFEGAFYIFIHVILAIWCIPVWILIKLGIVSELSIICFLWAKLLIVALTVICALIVVRIMESAKIEGIEFALFLIISSPLFFLPCFATAQYDTIELSMALLAVLFIVKENNLSNKSIIILSIAVSVKFLFVFPAILALLLYEKRVLKLIVKTIELLSVSILMFVISKLLLVFAPETGSVELGSEFAKRLFKTSIDGGYFNISVFFLVFFALCIFCYLCTSPNNSHDAAIKISWFVSAVYLAFFSFVATNENWPMLIVCFLIILLIDNKKTIRLNLLLEMIFFISLLFQHICCEKGGCYINERNFDYLLLKNVEHKAVLGDNCTAAYGILRTIGLDTFLPAITAIMLAAGVALLIINNPWKKITTELLCSGEIGISSNAARVIRLTILFGYFALQLLVSFVI